MEVDSFEPQDFEDEPLIEKDEKANEALEELKRLTESGGIKGGQLSRIRKLIKAIDSEIVILREMGSDWVERYFKAQQGSSLDNPYFLPNPIIDDQLGAYLDFECGDEAYRRQCVVEFITQPLDGDQWSNIRDLNLGCNLILSHLRHDIGFFLHINQLVTGSEMIAFLKRVEDEVANPSVRHSFGHLFDVKRWELLARYVEESKGGKRKSAKEILEKIKKQDNRFFDRLKFQGIFTR